MPDADYPLGNIARLTSSTQQQGGALNTLIWRVASVAGCCRFDIYQLLAAAALMPFRLQFFLQGAAPEHGLLGIGKQPFFEFS